MLAREKSEVRDLHDIMATLTHGISRIDLTEKEDEGDELKYDIHVALGCPQMLRNISRRFTPPEAEEEAENCTRDYYLVDETRGTAEESGERGGDRKRRR